MTTLIPKYTQVNTANRSIAQKFAETISVKDFGAVGDGTTDDTDAIQNAINAAERLYVPAGTYKVSGILSATSSAGTPRNLVIYGDSAASVIAFSNGGYLALSKSNYTSDFVLQDLSFTSDGNASTKVIFDVARGEIKNCTFSGFSLGLEVNQAYQLIEHNVFSNCTTGMKCIDNAVTPSAYYNGNSINSNLFAVCSVGLDLSHNVAAAGVGSSTLTALTMYQNTFETCTTAIKLTHISNSTIQSNYIEPDCTVGLDISNYCLNINVLNQYSPQSEINLDNSTINLYGGKLQDLTLSNSSTLRFIAQSDQTLGTQTVDGTSQVIYVPTYANSTNWTALIPASGWSNTGAPYQTARVYKDGLQTVFIEGVLTGGSVGSVMTVLPVGYRPSARIAFITGNVTSGTTAIIVIDSSGNLTQIAGSTSNLTISFSFKV